MISLSKETRIGWIGTGVMGLSMCRHIMNQGYPCTVYTRTKAKADALVAQGATWAQTPAELASTCDVIFTMVGLPQDVEEVYFGDQGLLSTAKKGAVVVDMTTTRPSSGREGLRQRISY